MPRVHDARFEVTSGDATLRACCAKVACLPFVLGTELNGGDLQYGAEFSLPEDSTVVPVDHGQAYGVEPRVRCPYRVYVIVRGGNPLTTFSLDIVPSTRTKPMPSACNEQPSWSSQIGGGWFVLGTSCRCSRGAVV